MFANLTDKFSITNLNQNLIRNLIRFLYRQHDINMTINDFALVILTSTILRRIDS